MKPCANKRKLITWLAMKALEGREAAALREHLARCEGCRGYWQEISKVSDRLATAQPEASIEAGESFHRRLTEKLQKVEPSSAMEHFLGWLRECRLNWRVALPVGAALAAALLAVFVLRQHPALPPQGPRQIVSSGNHGSELAPTIANYQMVANQSLEKFDELLTRQGHKELTPAPVYTASGFINAPF